MSDHWGRMTMIVLATLISGCELERIRNCGMHQLATGHRLLTRIEMDQVSAGSAVAIGNADALAVGAAPQTTASTNTLVSSGQLVSGEPFANSFTENYAVVQVGVSASNASLTQAKASGQLEVDSGGRGASIEAATVSMTAGSTSSQTQINMQFYGLSIGRVDLVFGTTTATACCAPTLEVQATAEGSGGGYLREYKASPITDGPGQVQSRVDIAVISSALPILDAGQVSVLVGPTLSQISSQ